MGFSNRVSTATELYTGGCNETIQGGAGAAERRVWRGAVAGPRMCGGDATGEGRARRWDPGRGARSRDEREPPRPCGRGGSRRSFPEVERAGASGRRYSQRKLYRTVFSPADDLSGEYSE